METFLWSDNASASGGYQCMNVGSRCWGAWDGTIGSGDCNINNLWGSYSAGAPANINLNGGIVYGPNSARADDGFSARCVLALKNMISFQF